MIRHRARDLGFGLCGVTRARPVDRADFIRQWLDAGHHGEMAYLQQHLDIRLDPDRLLPGARSIIAVADFHPHRMPELAHDPGDHAAGDEPGPPADRRPMGRIARYAWGDDYHKVLKRRLFTLADELRAEHPGEQFRVCVDTAPILEREHAVRAGLGWTGKHTLLIHPRLGSWMLLGEIVTTLDLPASAPGFAPGPDAGLADSPLDHCGTCTRCIDACPTQCIEPYRVNADRCISYLTLEHRGPIDPSLHEAMGDWIAGCDVCQAVCPFNQRRDRAEQAGLQPAPPIDPAYAPRPPAPGLDLIDLLAWSAQDRQEAFTRSALKRIKLDQLKRNALIALGHALLQGRFPHAIESIQRVADDPAESDLVRQTARQTLERVR